MAPKRAGAGRIAGAHRSQGPAGPQGPAGQIELVSCKAVTTGKGKRKKILQQCSTKLASSPVTITTAGASIAAMLSRGGVVYATGSDSHSNTRPNWCWARRRIGRGSYTLTLTHKQRRTHEMITID